MSLRRVDGQPIYHHAGLPNILSYDFLSYKLLFSKEKNQLYILSLKFWYLSIYFIYWYISSCKEDQYGLKMATAISPLKHVNKQITNAQFVQIQSVYVVTIVVFVIAEKQCMLINMIQMSGFNV